MSQITDLDACTPKPLSGSFNANANLPYGLKIEHVKAAMQGFIDFLGFVNGQLNTREIERLESMLMPANFSSIVGEFMSSNIPKYCSTIVKNKAHNGHPDLVPIDLYPGNAVRHASEGIEIKGSRYASAWQGHNAEDTWLMVFVFDSNRPSDDEKGIPAKPFGFSKVVGARLTKSDWKFSGRSGESRRTITASVTPVGYKKMMDNWLYLDNQVTPTQAPEIGSLGALLEEPPTTE